MTTRQLELDDARITYDARPGDGPPLVFVHGWACRRADWDQVLAALPGRQALALDLPWHGDSTSAHEDWTIADHGAVVARVVKAAGLGDVVLVGHSMGGAVAVEAARLLGPEVQRVVGIDSLTYMSIYPRHSDEAAAVAVDPFRVDFRAGVEATVEALFPDQTDRALMDRIVGEMAEIPPGPGIAALEALYRWDMESALAAVDTPIHVFAAQSHLTTEAVERLGDRVRITPVDLGGHFYLRERPADTARLVQDAVPSWSSPRPSMRDGRDT